MANTVFEPLAVRYMTDLIADFDLPDFQAAGIVGNGGGESAGFTKIQEQNPTAGVGGLGHFQWTGRSSTNNRRLVFERWLERNADKGWTPFTYEANYSMLYRELTGTERASLAALRRTATLEEATEVFMDRFERPGEPHLAGRIEWARKALAAFKAAGSPARPTVPAIPDARPTDDRFLPPLAGEVLPAGAIDPQQIISMFLTLLQHVLANPQIRAVIEPLLVHMLGLKAPPATDPKVTTPPTQRTGAQLGFAGIITALIGMATGHVGTPAGLGVEPTLAGNLSLLIPALIGGGSMLGGGWGGLLKAGLELLGKIPRRQQ